VRHDEIDNYLCIWLVIEFLESIGLGNAVALDCLFHAESLRGVVRLSWFSLSLSLSPP
jgi:hypothetical protein